MATEPVRRKCASSPTPDGKEGWQGIALEREQIGETDEEFRADVEFMEARAEKVLEERDGRRLLLSPALPSPFIAQGEQPVLQIV